MTEKCDTVAKDLKITSLIITDGITVPNAYSQDELNWYIVLFHFGSRLAHVYSTLGIMWLLQEQITSTKYVKFYVKIGEFVV